MDKGPRNPEQEGRRFLPGFQKGEEFTQELLRENEKLRYRLAQLEEVNKFSDREGTFKVHSLEERLRFLEEEK